MRRKIGSKRVRNSIGRSSQYQSLEHRRLLATSAFFNSGSLVVNFGAASDVAVVDVNESGNVTVNGSDQINVAGNESTVSAADVARFLSNGTSDLGQHLTLVGSLPTLSFINTTDVRLVSFQGSYGVDSLEISGAGTVSQSLSSALSVASETNIESTGDVSLSSASNDFGGRLNVTGNSVSVRDSNDLTLGPVTARGDLTIEASTVDSLFAPIVVSGNTSISVVDSMSTLMSPIETSNLTINASHHYSGVFLDNVNVRGDFDVSAASISGTNNWSVSGDTTVSSIALRGFLGDNVNLSDVDISTTDFNVSGPNGDVILGDATVRGNSTISGLRITAEQSAEDDLPGGAASSNAGGATISVNGSTTVSTQGSFDAANATINSDDLTIVSRFTDVILGTATTVIGDLDITTGGKVDAGSVTVGGDANIDAVGDVSINLVADGNVKLESEGSIALAGLSGNSATLTANESIENIANATINVGSTLSINAGSASFGNMAGDSLVAARMTATVENDLVIEQDSNVRLLNVAAGNFTVSSTGTISNRNDATIEIDGDASFSGTNVTIGHTENDTFNASRLSFNAKNAVQIDENSSTEIFESNSARTVNLKSSGNLTDDDNAVIDIAFSTFFEAANATIGDTATDQFKSRTLTFSSPGHMNISQDSRIFLTNSSVADRLTLATPVSVLDSPTTQIDVAGEVSFSSPYLNLGDRATDRFDAGSVSFNESNTVNLTENSDTVFSGNNDVRLAIIRSAGSISNLANASIEATSSSLFADGNIELGSQADDHLDIDRLRFNSPANVTIHQDDSLYFFGSNTAKNLTLFASGAIGDSATASFNVADRTSFSGSAIWIGEGENDTFNTGTLTVLATGSVIIGEDSLMLLEGTSTAFNLTLTAESVIADDDHAQITVQNFATFTSESVTIGDSETDCFSIVAGSDQLLVNAVTSNVIVDC